VLGAVLRGGRREKAVEEGVAMEMESLLRE
jgi:hypothetical protein